MYKETIRESEHCIIIKIGKQYCTRETNSTNTIPDSVCTNLQRYKFRITIVKLDMSDHKQIYIDIQNYKPQLIKLVSYEALSYDNLC